MQNKISRRALVKSGLLAGALTPVSSLLAYRAYAAPLPPLDPNDPTAKALGFVTDSSKVDVSTNPTHTAAQKCGTCAQFQGKTGDASGGCNIFTGHSVPQGGWCKVWAQKPSA
ncbi:MAG TPA: high-potential iron-sulfur protein [Steroidobacteraceae bacterium]